MDKLNDQLAESQAFASKMKEQSIELTKAKEDGQTRLAEIQQNLRVAQASVNDFKDKFDAQKPLIKELTVELADRESKLAL